MSHYVKSKSGVIVYKDPHYHPLLATTNLCHSDFVRKSRERQAPRQKFILFSLGLNRRLPSFYLVYLGRRYRISRAKGHYVQRDSKGRFKKWTSIPRGHTRRPTEEGSTRKKRKRLRAPARLQVDAPARRRKVKRYGQILQKKR